MFPVHFERVSSSSLLSVLPSSYAVMDEEDRLIFNLTVPQGGQTATFDIEGSEVASRIRANYDSPESAFHNFTVVYEQIRQVEGELVWAPMKFVSSDALVDLRWENGHWVVSFSEKEEET